MLLGYSLLQIPDLIILLSRKLEKYFAKKKIIRNYVSQLLQQININEQSSNNFVLETTPGKKYCNSKEDINELQLELEKVSAKFQRKLDSFSHELKGEIKFLKEKIDQF